jgi:hypothetical protein
MLLADTRGQIRCIVWKKLRATDEEEEIPGKDGGRIIPLCREA